PGGLPPERSRGVELRPTCVCLLLWLVSALLLELLPAPFEASWFALLFPPSTLPPATFTGTLALTAFWLASASDCASCSVVVCCSESCACPLPPQPTSQLELPPFWAWLLLCVVLALLLALLPAPFDAVWLALFSPAVMLPPAVFDGALVLTAFWLAS